MFSTRWRQAFYRCFRSSYRRNSTYSQSRCVHPWFRCSGVWASQVAPLYCGGFRAAGAEIAGMSGGMPAGWTRVSRVKYVRAPLVTPVAGTAKCFPRGGGRPFIVVFAVPTAATRLILSLVASTRGSDVPACGRHKWAPTLRRFSYGGRSNRRTLGVFSVRLTENSIALTENPVRATGKRSGVKEIAGGAGQPSY